MEAVVGEVVAVVDDVEPADDVLEVARSLVSVGSDVVGLAGSVGVPESLVPVGSDDVGPPLGDADEDVELLSRSTAAPVTPVPRSALVSGACVLGGA